jgi:hypothetical protein
LKTEVRLADAKDVPQFVEWIANTPNNLFDPDIARYKNLRTLAVEQDGKPVLYVPTHPVLMLESLAHSPDLSPKENARAIKAAHDALLDIAKAYGMAEIVWGCEDQSLINLAVRRGYEVLPYKVLRMKVS